MDDDNEPTVANLFNKFERGEEIPNLRLISSEIEELDPADLTWDDLCFIAERIMRTSLAKVDWAELRPAAQTMAHEAEDVADIVRLMQNAKIDVIVGGEE